MLKLGDQVELRTIPADVSTTTVAAQVLRRQGDQSTSFLFEGKSWTWAEYVDEAARRAGWLRAKQRPGPFHVGILLENVPEMVFFLAACGLAGAVAVALNPTRRGDDLARDIAHTDCQLLITDDTFVGELADVELPFGDERVCDVGSEAFANDLAAAEPTTDSPSTPADLFMLIFTSGTSGAPKAVKISHAKVTTPGNLLTDQMGFTSDDVLYCAMPLFHSNAIFVNWGVALASGATVVLRRRFSASNFLPDVRTHGVTYFNYVGRPLSYILATPERPDDADNALRLVIGNEAAERDIKRFSERFGCIVQDGFSSTEGGISVRRTADTPPGSIGRPNPNVAIANAETLELCSPAKFDDQGRVLNPDEAIGELVNLSGAGQFEGYYRNESADAERMRNGWYWSGDLAYLDEQGFAYFVGRTLDWLRVDGENFGAVPIEQLLARHSGIATAVVYAVPASDAGDEVMAAVMMKAGETFDPAQFAGFLQAQRDLGTKWPPRFVRIATNLPQTRTNKVLKRELARERWTCADPVFWRPGKEFSYRPLDDVDRASIRERFAAHGREHLLP